MRHTHHRRDVANARRLTAWLLVLSASLGLSVLTACGPATIPAPVIIAATATANEPAPALSPAIVHLLRIDGLTSTEASAYIVDPATGQPTVISLTPRRPGGQADYGPTRDQHLGASITAIQHVLDREATRGSFDLLTTIATATRAAPPPATLVVLSSGLSTAGGLDMRQAGWDLAPATIAAQLKARGLLPTLAGYHVIFSGLADTAGRQPPLPLPQQDTLIATWMAICQAAGARSCGIDNATRPDPPSRSTIPVPVVPVPAVASVRGPAGITTTTVPDTLLFAFNSSVLLPAADTILQPLVAQARGNLRISVTGYASPDGGTPAYNTRLSRRRAEAVARRLRSLGLPADRFTAVTGAGTGGETRAACLVGGQLDEAICAQLRRVVITTSPAAPSQ